MLIFVVLFEGLSSYGETNYTRYLLFCVIVLFRERATGKFLVSVVVLGH